jgi:hypothetical protein
LILLFCHAMCWHISRSSPHLFPSIYAWESRLPADIIHGLLMLLLQHYVSAGGRYHHSVILAFNSIHIRVLGELPRSWEDPGILRSLTAIYRGGAVGVGLGGWDSSIVAVLGVYGILRTSYHRQDYRTLTADRSFCNVLAHALELRQ